jgi:TolB protein
MAYKRLLWVLVGLLVMPMMSYAQDGERILGKIAYIGTDNNVYVWQGLEEDVIQLTDDASRSVAGLRRYQMPTWSTDGRLAYFSTDRGGGEYRTKVFVSEDGLNDGVLVYEGVDEVLNYAAWSPGGCGAAVGCRELAMLFNQRQTGGLFVRVVQDGVTDYPSDVIGRGGPFYFSWSGDGERMIWQRNNSRLDVFDVVNREVLEQLPYVPGVFQTPHWSPVDDRVLFGVMNEDNATTDLTVLAGDEVRTLAEALEGVVYFGWSPDGEQVAYTMRNGSVVVVDAANGRVLTRTMVEGIGPFFWSPDSKKVAFVTLARPEGTFTTRAGGMARPAPQRDVPALAWSVVDIDTGEVRRYSAFIPTPEMVYIFTYFDQFAESHSVWSPDSRYLVYGEVNEDEERIISIIDTSVQDTLPLAIADGVLGIWSYDE